MNRLRQILRSLVRLVRQGDDLGAVLRGALVVLAVQGGGAVAGFLVMVVLSRWMGATAFGIYTFVIAWATILAIPAGLGLPVANVRYIAQYLAAEDHGKLHGLIGRSRIITVILGATLAAVGIGSVLLADQFIAPHYVLPLCIGLIAVPFIAWLNLESQIAQGFDWVGLAFAPRDVVRPLLLLGVVAVMSALGFVMTAISVVAAAVFAHVAVVLVQRWMIGRRVTRTIPAVESQYDTALWLSVALPLLLSSGFYIVMSQSDLVMVGMLRSPEEVAFYQGAARISGLVLIVMMAINARTAPRISALHSMEKRAELQHLLSRLMHWIFWPSLLAAAIVIGFGDLLLSLFGADFVAGYPALIILTVGTMVNAVAGPVGLLLNMTGHQHLCAKIFGTSALINIVLNMLLIPRWGIVGAALATAASMILWNLWLLFMVARKLDLHPSFIRVPTLRRS